MIQSLPPIAIAAALVTAPLLTPVALAGAPTTAGTISDAHDWYQDSYAPLWANNPSSNIDAIVSHYQPSITSYDSAGGITTDDSASWIGAPINQWIAEGWLKSELVDLRTDVINDSTATFKAKWKDSYKGAKSDYACGWYLANKIEGSWQFTTHADLDCALLK